MEQNAEPGGIAYSTTVSIAAAARNGCDLGSSLDDDVYKDFFEKVATKPCQTYEQLLASFPTLKNGGALDMDLKPVGKPEPLPFFQPSAKDPLRVEWEAAAVAGVDDVEEVECVQLPDIEVEELDEDGVALIPLSRASSGCILDGPGLVQVDNFCLDVDPDAEQQQPRQDQGQAATATATAAATAADHAAAASRASGTAAAAAAAAANAEPATAQRPGRPSVATAEPGYVPSAISRASASHPPQQPPGPAASASATAPAPLPKPQQLLPQTPRQAKLAAARAAAATAAAASAPAMRTLEDEVRMMQQRGLLPGAEVAAALMGMGSSTCHQALCRDGSHEDLDVDPDLDVDLQAMGLGTGPMQPGSEPSDQAPAAACVQLHPPSISEVSAATAATADGGGADAEDARSGCSSGAESEMEVEVGVAGPSGSWESHGAVAFTETAGCDGRLQLPGSVEGTTPAAAFESFVIEASADCEASASGSSSSRGALHSAEVAECSEDIGDGREPAATATATATVSTPSQPSQQQGGPSLTKSAAPVLEPPPASSSPSPSSSGEGGEADAGVEYVAVEQFKLDPGFDYDNCPLTPRPFPYNMSRCGAPGGGRGPMAAAAAGGAAAAAAASPLLLEAAAVAAAPTLSEQQ